MLRSLAQIALVAAFLALVGLQSTHSHLSTSHAKADCQTCKVLGQSQPLVTPPPPVSAPLVIERLALPEVASPYTLFVATSHGLSPPVI